MTKPVFECWNLTKEQAVDRVLSDLLSKCFPAPCTQIRHAYEWLQTCWGCKALLSGTRECVEEILRTNLTRDMQRGDFDSFAEGVYSDPPPTHANVFSVLKRKDLRWKTFLGYCLWLSQEGLFLAAHADALLGNAPLDRPWLSLYRQSLAVHGDRKTAQQVVFILDSFLCSTLPAIPENSVAGVIKAVCEKRKYREQAGTWDEIKGVLVPILASLEPGFHDWRWSFLITPGVAEYAADGTVTRIAPVDPYAKDPPKSVVLSIHTLDRLEARVSSRIGLFRTEHRWLLLLPE